MSDTEPALAEVMREIIGTQKVRDVARRAGIHYTMLYEVLRGHHPRRDVIAQIAERLNLSYEQQVRLYRAAGIPLPAEAPMPDFETLAERVAELVAEKLWQRLKAEGVLSRGGYA